jgi:hypothetical protein
MHKATLRIYKILRVVLPQYKRGVNMADELIQRREFLKRAGIAASVLATSVVAVAATSEDKHRGANENTGNGVVTGNSNKKEILYKKTQLWSEFYSAAQ